jgi:sugar lactone lactonase YvrE
MTSGFINTAWCRHIRALNFGFVFLLLGGSLAPAADIIYVSDPGAGTISEINSSGTESTFASGLSSPEGLAIDNAGNLYVADSGAGTISKINMAGNVSTFVSGLNNPAALAFGSGGNLYIANLGNRTLSKINSQGNASVFASGLIFNQAGSYLASDSVGNIYANLYQKTISPGRIEQTVTRFNSKGKQTIVAQTAGSIDGIAVNGAEYLYYGIENPGAIVGNGTLHTSIVDYPAPYNSDPAYAAFADAPGDLAFDKNGNLFVTFDELVTPSGGGLTDALVEFGANGVNTLIASNIGGLDIAVQSVNSPVPCVPEPGILSIVTGLAAVWCIRKRSNRRSEPKCSRIRTLPSSYRTGFKVTSTVCGTTAKVLQFAQINVTIRGGENH